MLFHRPPSLALEPRVTALSYKVGGRPLAPELVTGGCKISQGAYKLRDVSEILFDNPEASRGIGICPMTRRLEEAA